MKVMKKRDGLFTIFVLFFLVLQGVSALEFNDVSGADFSAGSFLNTVHNGSSVVLQNLVTSGNFTSRIFDSGFSSNWETLSWDQGLPHGLALPNFKVNESDRGGVDMFSNVLLLHLNESSGAAVDFSGEGNNGSVIGGATYDSEGIFSSAISFDGASGYISVPHSNSLSLNEDYSFEFWFNPATDLTEWRRFIYKNGQIDVSYIGGNRIRVQISGYATVDSVSAIQRGTWNHIVVTFANGPMGDDAIRLYVNGVLEKSIVNQWGTPQSGTNPLLIGGTGGEFFKASFDEVAFYNSTLSDEAVRARYSRGALLMNMSTRSCANSDCSDGVWTQTFTQNPSNLEIPPNQYFQYRTFFSSRSSSISPELLNVSIYYSIANSAPEVFILSPLNSSISKSEVISLNLSVSDPNANTDSCWYSLDNGINFSLPNCLNNTVSATTGAHVLRVFANDSAGAVGGAIVSFTVDNVAPSITVFTPQNLTYATTSLFLNYSVVDNLNVDSCWYSLDGSFNISLNGCSTASLSIGDGDHVLYLFANDSAGNVQTDDVLFSVDTRGPIWYSPINLTPAYYSENLSFFRISLVDSSEISDVFFESNFSGIPRNYSMYSQDGETFEYNSSLPAGTFYWKVFANDSLGNVNISQYFTFAIGRSGNFLNLYLNEFLNQNLSVVYGESINATVFSEFGSPSLYRDGVLVPSGEILSLGANPEGYSYLATVSETQNYSGNSTLVNLFMNKSSGNASLYLNGAESDLNLTYGEQVNSTVFSNQSTSVYRNGNQILNSDLSVLGAGLYNYTVFAEENQNFTGFSKTFFVEVSKALPSLNLLLNGDNSDLVVNYSEQTNVSAWEVDEGDNDITYALYKDETYFGGGSFLEDIETYRVGSYNYLFNSSGGENYSSGSVSRVLTITKANPNLEFYIDGIESNSTQIYGNLTNLTTFINSDLEHELLMNDQIMGSGPGGLSLINTYAAGDYSLSALFLGNENYTSSVKNLSLTILKSSPQMTLSINGYQSSISVTAGSSIEINASILSPPGELISLYENDFAVQEGFSQTSILKDYPDIGTFEWTAVFLGSQNYSAQNISYTIGVTDENYPQYSNLKVSPSSDSAYHPNRKHSFNVTWTDNVGIDEVIFSLNGTNFSFSEGGLSKNGNEYFFVSESLGAGQYSYRWYANDTSGNMVFSPAQVYRISKSPLSLVIQMTPSNSVLFGTAVSVTCFASNSESQVSLIRDITPIDSLPDSGVFAVGSYTYYCNSLESSNYSSGSAIPQILAVQKGNPVLNLSLNGVESNLVLPSGGGSVEINASISTPSNGQIALLLDGVVLGNESNFVSNSSIFSASGVYNLSVIFEGNENYSASSITRTVSVSSPVNPPSNNGGSSGGSSSGGSRGGGPIIIPTVKNYSLSIENIDDLILKRGTVESFPVKIKNTGNTFLNNCRLSFLGDASFWLSSEDSKGLSPGETFEFSALAKVPADSGLGSYPAEVSVRCEEFNMTKPVKVEVYWENFEITLREYYRDATDLRINYTLKENAHEFHDVVLSYTISDLNGLERVSGQEVIVLAAGATLDRTLVIRLPKDMFGEFNIRIGLSNGVLNYSSEKEIFLPTTRGLTGLAVSESQKERLSKIGIAVGVLALVGLLVWLAVRIFSHKPIFLHRGPAHTKRLIPLKVR